MLDKVQNACIKALSKVDKLEIRGMPRVMVYLFLFIVIFVLLLFLTAWIWQWHDTGKAELSILIQFVNAITSVSFIAAVGFFGRAMLDKCLKHRELRECPFLLPECGILCARMACIGV